MSLLEETIGELIAVILEQERKINRLQRKIDRINQYIAYYETNIKERKNDNSNKA